MLRSGPSDSLSMTTPAIRAVRLAYQIRDYLSAWTLRLIPGTMVVVTRVTLRHDLRAATAWVRIIGPDQGRTFQLLLDKSPQFQHKLRVNLSRHSIPALTFAIDQGDEEDGAEAPLLKIDQF